MKFYNNIDNIDNYQFFYLFIINKKIDIEINKSDV